MLEKALPLPVEIGSEFAAGLTLPELKPPADPPAGSSETRRGSRSSSSGSGYHTSEEFP